MPAPTTRAAPHIADDINNDPERLRERRARAAPGAGAGEIVCSMPDHVPDDQVPGAAAQARVA